VDLYSLLWENKKEKINGERGGDKVEKCRNEGGNSVLDSLERQLMIVRHNLAWAKASAHGLNVEKTRLESAIEAERLRLEKSRE